MVYGQAQLGALYSHLESLFNMLDQSPAQKRPPAADFTLQESPIRELVFRSIYSGLPLTPKGVRKRARNPYVDMGYTVYYHIA
jgi:hypothetical protein